MLRFALLFCFCLFPLTVLAEIDDSSYESLFKAAYRSEIQNGLTKETLEALVKFDALELMSLVEPPYRRKEPSESWGARQRVADDTFIVAERLFREKRIDKGINFLKTMLPPQAPEDGMLTAGYVSEALLEQKRFEEAWQIADSGLPSERANNICRYIQRTIAKTFHEEERSYFAFSADSAHFNLKYNMSLPDRERLFPPLVPNEADTKIYRTEANRAFEELRKRPKPARDERAVIWATGDPSVAVALAALGRSDEAFALAKTEDHRGQVMRTILYERRRNGTPEEFEQWFQKARELYKAEGIPGRNDPRRNIMPTPWPATNNYIECCLEFGKYLDAMDAMENHAGQNERNFRHPDNLFYKIPRLNVETEFRHNSKELVERMLKQHEIIIADEKRALGTYTGSPDKNSSSLIYSSILAAQLNLGLVDDALETLRKITNSPETYRNFHFIGFPTGPLGSIVLYVLKNKTPEEANRIETESIEMFKKADGAERRKWEERYLIDYYRNLAMRLMQDGESEMGARYLKMAQDKAEEQQKRQEETEQRVNPRSEMERFCVELIIRGELDKATEIADRLGLPDVFLYLAERRAETGEMEKAKAAMNKTLAAIPPDEVFRPSWVGGTPYSRLARLAVKFGDKELFYDIMNTKAKIADKETWHEGPCSYPCREALSDFTRQLAVYGDKDHPLFSHVEKYADNFQEAGIRAELCFSLGVSRAMLGDHENARRLLKKGLMQPQERYGSKRAFCAAVIEARSYE